MKILKNIENFKNVKIIQFDGTINSLIHQMYLLNKKDRIDLLYVGQGSASLLNFSDDFCTQIAGLLSNKGKIILSFLNKDSQIINNKFLFRCYIHFNCYFPNYFTCFFIISSYHCFTFVFSFFKSFSY